MRLGGRKYEAVHGLGVGGGCGSLRSNVEAINDKRVLEKIAAIEGKQARYHVEALMIQAKRVLRAEDAAKPDVGAITAALTKAPSKPPKSFPARAPKARSAPCS